MPTFSVTACSWNSRPPTRSVSPNGIDANATRAKKTDTNGASEKRSLSARAGRKSSFVSILMASARGWNSPMARKPRIEARLAPIRSCMMADCLRSTQVSSPPRFRTNIITNMTRPKATPRSSITGSGRDPGAPPRRWGHARRGRARDHLAGVADALVRQPREARDGAAQLAEPVLGPAAGRRPAGGREDAAEQVPLSQRRAERLHRRPEALHASLEVRERALALDPGRRREHPVGALARG